MKKVTILLSVFALVMGLSQCRKPSFSALNGGETQHVVLSANNGNDGSKVDVDFVQEAMNLTWEKGDEIKVSGGLNGKLTLVSGDGGPEATFEGYATRGAGDVVFTYGGTPVFMGQTGTPDCVKGNIRLEGTSEYKDDGNYSVLMKVPYAVLKLDLSAFADDTKKDGVTVTIKADGETVASVSDVKNDADSKELYVAVKVDKTPSVKPYTFRGNGKVASCKGWELKANTFYTEKGEGVPTGNAIKIVAVPGFSVSATEYVQFSRGNLYYDGSSWQFEANQWDFRTYADNNSCINGGYSDTGTPSGHWGLFGWSTNATDYGKSISSNSSSYSGSFKDWGGLAIGGYAADTWRTLSKAEWDYLLNSRTGASSLRAWVTLEDVNVSGLVILPDGSSATASGITTSSALGSSGAVFLPAAGARNGTGVYDVGLIGNYWSNTPNEDDEGYAYYMGFNSGYYVSTILDCRYYGHAVRLVR